MNSKVSLIYVVCAVVFVAFCFCYLFFYQADMLALMQHTYSNGQTHYNRFWGAILIALLLLSVNVFICRLHDFSRLPSMSFFPSGLILAYITGVRQNDDMLFSFGFITCVSFISLFIYLMVLRYKRHLFVCKATHASNGLTLKSLCLNLAVMSGILMYVCAFSNSDKMFHVRASMMRCLDENEYDKALSCMAQLDRTDEKLTTLTIFALSKKNMLAEKLFEYPLKGQSSALLPNNIVNSTYDSDAIYRHLGIPSPKRRSINDVKYIESHYRNNKSAADYILCGYLFDKNLNAFVENLTRYYDINDQLPKHYREALTLYVHSHTSPKIIFKNSITDADFQDYQRLDALADKDERNRKLRNAYGNTYWFYYQYVIS